MQQQYLTRQEAAAYVRERYGLPCSPRTLAKLATVGGGPVYRRAGLRALYAPADMDEWVASRMSAPVRSTSELEAGA